MLLFSCFLLVYLCWYKTRVFDVDRASRPGHLEQQSLTFLASEAGFVEDNFSMGQGREVVLGLFRYITFKLTSCCV